MSKLYIMTGGPGAGKTSLLEELEKQGFIIVPEEGRRIIKEQMITHGNALPWMDRRKFAELMFKGSVNAYQEMSKRTANDTVFFDCGILDAIGYMRLEKLPVPKEMEIIACEMAYQKNVFIFPPWKEIYKNDPERKQTLEGAISTFECMRELYLEYGYNIIEVPKLSIQERAGFVLDSID
ncbi:AAA family ATPase [Chryseobacterium indologenes]|uniref:AAA family ATPase n=1 Tax=Chryseobacterium indologenes TaxID=253 RepID=UPI0003E06CA1|nr:AAA family ATPase [Chryseobacterium indologenes]QPQ51021.1 AAA family ATPase [Chryseobacterium indologenes]GAE65822.1 hypothetical protein CIN01S_12_01940 [Chryseobacterium indologenes NBRC 14944]SFK06453.1 Predicted ATPase [Chryseobacterium indologenes]SUX49374.1 Uncharacterised protein [Chryseobacterium indologenes]